MSGKNSASSTVWLHPAHSLDGGDAKPKAAHFTELKDTTSTQDRLVVLGDIVSNIARTLNLRCDTGDGTSFASFNGIAQKSFKPTHRVRHHRGHLLVMNSQRPDQPIVWIPLCFSHVAHAHSSEFKDDIGPDVAAQGEEWGVIGLCVPALPQTMRTSMVDNMVRALENSDFDCSVWFLLVSGSSASLDQVINVTSSCGVLRADFNKSHRIVSQIGSGTYSKVFLVDKITTSLTDTPTRYALKAMTKSTGPSSVVVEMLYLSVVQRHPNIVGFHGVFLTMINSQPYWCLMLDMCEGGDLYDRVVNRGTLSEREGFTRIGELFAALMRVHGCGIIHRDVKSENVLLASDGRAVLADFGIAVDVTQDLTERFGSPGYIAPEVLLEKPYDTQADIFSGGVVAYFAFSAMLPFHGNDVATMCKNTTTRQANFSSRRFQDISFSAKDFVKLLLSKKVHARPTATQALVMIQLHVENLDKASRERTPANDEKKCGSTPTPPPMDSDLGKSAEDQSPTCRRTATNMMQDVSMDTVKGSHVPKEQDRGVTQDARRTGSATSSYAIEGSSGNEATRKGSSPPAGGMDVGKYARRMDMLHGIDMKHTVESLRLEDMPGTAPTSSSPTAPEGVKRKGPKRAPPRKKSLMQVSEAQMDAEKRADQPRQAAEVQKPRGSPDGRADATNDEIMSNTSEKARRSASTPGGAVCLAPTEQGNVVPSQEGEATPWVSERDSIPARLQRRMISSGARGSTPGRDQFKTVHPLMAPKRTEVVVSRSNLCTSSASSSSGETFKTEATLSKGPRSMDHISIGVIPERSMSPQAQKESSENASSDDDPKCPRLTKRRVMSDDTMEPLTLKSQDGAFSDDDFLFVQDVEPADGKSRKPLSPSS